MKFYENFVVTDRIDDQTYKNKSQFKSFWDW